MGEPGFWDDNGTPIDNTDDVWTEGDYSLREDSPCIGTGEGGVNMGADLGICPGILFRRGDANGDAEFNISDVSATLNYLFQGGVSIGCADAADSNDDGAIDISDAITSLQVLFAGGGVIPAPGAETCGSDPSDDRLGCETPPNCP